MMAKCINGEKSNIRSINDLFRLKAQDSQNFVAGQRNLRRMKGTMRLCQSIYRQNTYGLLRWVYFFRNVRMAFYKAIKCSSLERYLQAKFTSTFTASHIVMTSFNKSFTVRNHGWSNGRKNC